MPNEELTKQYAKTVRETGDPKKPKLRSPAYTSIGLREAVEKARLIWEHEKRNEVAVDVVAEHWKVAPKSSATLMAISTLKKFGLITDRGSGDQRYIKLTDLAYNILKSDPGSPSWITNVQKAALSPKIIAELWESDKENPKSTPSLKKHLEFEKHFNPLVIDEFIQSYRDTISFAKLGFGDRVLTNESGDDENGETPNQETPVIVTAEKPNKPMLSSITATELPIPIAEGRVARVPYPMAEEDFDLFIETLKLWKKKLVKVAVAEPPTTPPKPEFPKPPFAARRKSETGETMVKIIGQPWFENGKWMFQAEGGIVVPANELFPDLKK